MGSRMVINPPLIGISVERHWQAEGQKMDPTDSRAVAGGPLGPWPPFDDQSGGQHVFYPPFARLLYGFFIFCCQKAYISAKRVSKKGQKKPKKVKCLKRTERRKKGHTGLDMLPPPLSLVAACGRPCTDCLENCKS